MRRIESMIHEYSMAQPTSRLHAKNENKTGDTIRNKDIGTIRVTAKETATSKSLISNQ